MKRLVWMLVLSAGMCALSPTASADSANETAASAMEAAASALWDQAAAETDAEKKRTAFGNVAKTYEEAHRLNPRFERIRTAASAWKNAGDDVKAANALEESLRHAPPAADRQETERLLASLDASLARVVVRGPPGSSLMNDGVALPTPASVRRAPGENAIAITREGGVIEERNVRLRAGMTETIDFSPPPPVAPTTPPPSPTPTDAGPSGMLIAGGVMIGIGAAGGIATAVIAGLGYSADDDAELEGPGSPSIEEAIDYQRAAWIAGATSAAVGVTGAILLIVDATRTSDDRASASVCNGPGVGVAICGRF